MDISLRRVIAFCIDMVIVSFVTSLVVTYIPINPYSDEYNDTYDEYTELVNDIGDDEEKVQENENRIIELNYDLYKYRAVDNLVSVAFIVLYFGVFQMIAKGTTIGKKIMKLQVVSNKDKKLNFGNYLLRTMFLTNIIITLVCIVLVYITKDKVFYYLSSGLGLAQYVLYLTNILMITIRKDNRGLHDIIGGTKVISLVEENNEVDNKKEVIETKEEVTEKKESIKEKVEKKESKSKKK